LIHGQIAIHTCQDGGRHLIESQQSTGDDLTTTLKSEKGEGYEFAIIDVVVRDDHYALWRRNEAGFDESSRDDDAEGLEEEGEGEGETGRGTDIACEGEEDAAEEEEEDGDEGFDPAVGMGCWLTGCTEGEEDCVAWGRMLVMRCMARGK